MAHQNWMQRPSGGSSCPAPMTRAALLALRAAGTLIPGCHYTVTDHVQNRLVAGTTVTVHAVATNELSETALVNTTYDNEAWDGVYDLDRALVLELVDNRGNVAKGFNGTEVANFDWGNTAYTGCRVENATWTVNYGNPSFMTNVHVYNVASLNTTGFNGQITNSSFHTAVNAIFVNATGIWRYSEWKNTGTFNITGYAGGSDSFYNEFDNFTLNATGMTGLMYFRTSELQNSSFTVQGSQTFRVDSSEFKSYVFNRPAGGGAVILSQCSSVHNSNTTVSGAGTLTATGTVFNGTVSVTSTGNLLANYCKIEQGASVQCLGLGSMSMTRTYIEQVADVRADAGSNVTMTVNDTVVRTSSSVRAVGAAATGTFTVLNTTIESSSFINKSNTGDLTVNQCRLTGSSGINATAGNRAYSIVRANLSEVSRMTLSGTGAVTDNYADIRMGYRGSWNVSCSGAANSVLYSEVSGLSGSFTLAGTTGGQSYTRLKLNDGSINVTNCTVNLGLQLIDLSDFGTANFSNVAVARTYNYINLSSNGNLTVNAPTGGGLTTSVNISAAGILLQNGAAAGFSRGMISVGQVTHNGGSVQNLNKSLIGVLTTGNFNHTGVVHMSNTNKTLTAANNNRGDYAGVTSAQPLI